MTTRSGGHVALRVLLVEQHAANSMLLEEMLRLDDHAVTTCNSGMAALETLTTANFDLLLLGDTYADMDGARLLQTYRFGRLQSSPAVFLTADESPATADRLRQAGAASILYAPFSLENLRAVLNEISPKPSPVARRPAAPQLVAVSSPGAPEEPTTERVADTGTGTTPKLAAVPIGGLDETVLAEVRQSVSANFWAKWLTAVGQDIEKSTEQLAAALSGSNYPAIPRLAESLKDVSASVGADRLVTLANKLIGMTSDDLRTSRNRLAQDVRASATATIEAIASHMPTPSRAPSL